MSNRIGARNKKAGLSPAQQAKRVDAAADIRLGEMLGSITYPALDPLRCEVFRDQLLDLMNQAIAHGAPGYVINILDGLMRGLDEAKNGA